MYDTLIDAETWAFIQKTEDYYPVDTIEASIHRQREIYDRMCRAFFQGYPPGLQVKEDQRGGVPVRHYRSNGNPLTVVYFHGGGFVVGGLDSHDDICAELCARTGFDVISVDYRLAPEHKHPAMYDDALAAARAIATNGPILLCGDSAGGTLAAAVAHSLRSNRHILGQVLIYPALGGDIDKGSYLTHAQAPMLRSDDVAFYTRIRCNDRVPTGDPRFAPLQDTNFTALPPTVAISAECDPLADDARDYVAKIQHANGRAVWLNETGLVHGYLRGRKTVRRAAESFDRIVAALTALAQGALP